MKVCQIGLSMGADDFGSAMLEENVVSAAGTVHHLTLTEMRSAISELGWIPRRRNVFYELFEDDDGGPHVAALPAAATGAPFGCGSAGPALIQPSLVPSAAKP
jgi:hypothetical protein